MKVNPKAILSTIQARQMLSQGLEQEIKALHHIKPWHHVVYLFYPLLGFGGVVVALHAYCLGLGWNLASVQYGLGVLCVALAMNAMFLLVHEGVHGILLSNKFLNGWVSVAIAGLGFFSFSAYRVLHLRHHEYLGDERDPDDYRNYTNNRTVLWLLHYSRLLCATLVYLIFVPILAFRYGSRSDRVNIVTEYLLIGLAYITLLIMVPWKFVVVGWLVPFLLTNFTINIRGLCQHGITDTTDPFTASRTVESNSSVRFFLLNENFHLEHHLFPAVPSYNLVKLHHLISDRLPQHVTCSSYTSFLLQFVRASLRQDDSPIGLTIASSAHKAPLASNPAECQNSP